MANTTNFGWETPDDTDLVKDGAAAMRTLGNAIDTSFVDLKGGTTGQILSKASNTDLDYTWITNEVGDITAVTAGTGLSGGGTSGDVTLTNTVATAFDAKGDLVVGTGADTFAKLTVGANDTIPVAASGETTGIKWQGTRTSFTPSWTNFTLGNGSLNYAEYVQHGKLVFFNIRVTLGSTSSISGADLKVAVPVTGMPAVVDVAQATGVLLDAGTAAYLSQIEVTGDVIYISFIDASGTAAKEAAVTSTAPFTWTTNDRIYVSGWYYIA